MFTSGENQFINGINNDEETNENLNGKKMKPELKKIREANFRWMKQAIFSHLEWIKLKDPIVPTSVNISNNSVLSGGCLVSFETVSNVKYKIDVHTRASYIIVTFFYENYTQGFTTIYNLVESFNVFDVEDLDLFNQYIRSTFDILQKTLEDHEEVTKGE